MIEKVFHQIWINKSDPELPARFRPYRDSWLEHHPRWEYRLWNLENLDFQPECGELLPQCRHPAQMADLLRMEILHRHGGVYVDTDFECLKPIDGLIEKTQTFGCSEDGCCISIGIIGCQKGSSILRNVIDSFPSSIPDAEVNVATGPAFFTKVILTKGFDGDFTLFPTHYFYPFNFHTPNRELVDLSQSYAVHHYADSWKKPVPVWRRLIARAKRAF
jgi:inositol phosphorylceramide mannosyltransferase catalytic subunit